MSDPTASRTVIVTDPAGVHARTATMIAQIVRKHQSRVLLWKDEAYRVQGTDVLQMLSLAAPCGTTIYLSAEGPDAEQVLDLLTPVFADYENGETPP